MRDVKHYTILSAAAATGAGNKIFVGDADHVILHVNTASSANLTVKFQGSSQETAPDFGSAASPTNAWDYIQVKDLEDGSSIDGDTGIAPAGTDDQRVVEVNVNGLTWLTANVTARSAGSVTVTAALYAND